MTARLPNQGLLVLKTHYRQVKKEGGGEKESRPTFVTTREGYFKPTAKSYET